VKNNKSYSVVATTLLLSLLLALMGPSLAAAKALDREIEEADGNQDNFFREALNGKSVSCHNVNDEKGNYIEGEYEVTITYRGKGSPIVKKVKFTIWKKDGKIGNSSEDIEVPMGADVTGVDVAI